MKTKRLYIEDAIKKAGVKKMYVAERLGLSQSNFTHLLNGVRKLDFTEVKKMAIILGDANIILDFLYDEHMISLYPGVLKSSSGEVWTIIEQKKKYHLVECNRVYAIVFEWNPAWCAWERGDYFSTKEEALKAWVNI